MSTAENDLRCNNFKCRVYVATEGKAVVTTCSHVFCIDCVNHLFSPNLADRICPACDEALPGEDDVVVSCLNPSSDYRSTIMSGLAPAVVLDIASRAIGFWTYQSSQEIGFQAMSLKHSKEQVARLEQELTLVRGELHNTQRRNRELEDQLNTATRTTHNVIQDARDKDKDMTKLRAHYDKIKRKSLLGSAVQAVEEENTKPLSAIPPNMRSAPLAHHQPIRAPIGTPNHRPHPYHASPGPLRGIGYAGSVGPGTPAQAQMTSKRRFQGLAGGSRTRGGTEYGMEDRKVPRFGGPAF